MDGRALADRSPASALRVQIADFAESIGIILALMIAVVFIGVLWGTIDFPLGTHADEAVKVDSILKNHNQYYHPILMVQLVRGANALAGLSDPQAVVELGRRCAVVAGGFAIFATYLLARKVLPIPTALAAAVAASVVPLVTVHARYFKEDVFVLPFLLLAILSLITMIETPTVARGMRTGTAVGLAAAAKYVAAITLPFVVVFLLIGPWRRVDRRSSLICLGLVVVIALAVFALVELPAFLDFARLKYAVGFELGHASRGHDVRLPVSTTHGLFHLRESLLPGLGLPLLMLGLFGLIAPWLAPSERRRPLLIIATFALLWYAAHEFTPLKPFPGFARYMLPLAPLLIILGAALVYELMQPYRWASAAAAFVIIAAAAPALYLSLLINGPAQEDLRVGVAQTVLDIEPRTTFDGYTRFAGTGGVSRKAAQKSLATEAITANILVTSNFSYGRFTQLVSMRKQSMRTRALAAYYTEVFRLPYLEVTNGRPSYGFFNPVLRIVALDGRQDRLPPIAAALHLSHSALAIRVVNTQAPHEIR